MLRVSSENKAKSLSDTRQLRCHAASLKNPVLRLKSSNITAMDASSFLSSFLGSGHGNTVFPFPPLDHLFFHTFQPFFIRFVSPDKFFHLHDPFTDRYRAPSEIFACLFHRMPCLRLPLEMTWYRAPGKWIRGFRAMAILYQNTTLLSIPSFRGLTPHKVNISCQYMHLTPTEDIFLKYSISGQN